MITHEDWVEAKTHVGPGWHHLIDYIAGRLTRPDLSLAQVKEKFGYFTVYVDGMTEEERKVVNDMELESGWTCEECGKPGFRCGTGNCDGPPHYWMKTLCIKHQGERHEGLVKDRERMGYKVVKP